MNSKQALKIARDKWGKSACVSDDGKPNVLPNGTVLSERCKVGTVMMGMFFSVKGDGKTWEEAFQKADESEAIEKKRYKDVSEGKKNVRV